MNEMEMHAMKIGLTVWDNRISPVFDAAHTLLVVEIEHNEVAEKKYVPLQPGIPHHQVSRLMAQNIQALICGAISEVPARMVEASGIRLISFISGQTDDVLTAYINGNLQTPAFWMPGYGFQRRRRFRGNFR